MAARGKFPPAIEGRPAQAPGMMRHGPYPGLSSATDHRPAEPLPPQLLENKVATQEAEIERLVGDNRRLATTHVALREELVATVLEVQKLKADIRSIQTESDIQIRVLLDKIAKMEVDIRAGESVKKDLQQAHIEAQSLAAARQELSGQIQGATQELQKALSDVKSMPDLEAELDSLVQEHQRLRGTFEYEKNKNIELVEQLKATEKNLIGMAREVEILRAEILNVEKRGHAPDLYAAKPVHGSGSFVDAYGRAHGQMAIGQVGGRMIPYDGSNGMAAVDSAGGGAAVWTGPNHPSIARQ